MLESAYHEVGRWIPPARATLVLVSDPSKAKTRRDRPVTLNARRDDELVDVLLTAPLFVVYHLGIVFMSVRNGFDPITDSLLSVLHRSLPLYLGITLLVAGLLFAVVKWTRIGGKIKATTFAIRIGESTLYAFAMAAAARAAVAQTLSVPKLSAAGPSVGPLSAIVLSSGAGFYEELAFRVVLFGAGAWLVHKLFKATGGKIVGEIVWALVAAASFSAVHYLGSLGDSFTFASFVFRLVCGLVLTAVYRFRGFAAAVWTHALYDIGVMAF
jgi:hypothetical protein